MIAQTRMIPSAASSQSPLQFNSTRMDDCHGSGWTSMLESFVNTVGPVASSTASTIAEAAVEAAVSPVARTIAKSVAKEGIKEGLKTVMQANTDEKEDKPTKPTKRKKTPVPKKISTSPLLMRKRKPEPKNEKKQKRQEGVDS